MIRLGAPLVAAALLCGCTGQVIKDVQTRNLEGRTDGAVIGYFLPKATWKFTVQYEGAKGLLSAIPDAKPSIVPDTNAPMRFLSYGHSEMSNDDVNVKLDGLMLNTISSTTADQSLKIVEAVNTLISQVGSAKDTFEKSTDKSVATDVPKAADDTAQAKCGTDLKSEVVVDLSAITYTKPKELIWGENCKLVITSLLAKVVGVSPLKTHVRSAAPFLASPTLDDQQDICARAVCFRPAHLVEVTLVAEVHSNLVGSDGITKLPAPSGTFHPLRLKKAGSAPAKLQLSQTYPPVAVPSARAPLAFVEFTRRAFVENKTTIVFSQGIVSEFKSTDPSIVAGAIKLTSDALKAVVLSVALVK